MSGMGRKTTIVTLGVLLLAVLILGYSSSAVAQVETGGFEPGGLCNNGEDDDNDGLIDLNDSSCHEALCQNFYENGEPIDDDGDGLPNGLDPDCQCLSDLTGFGTNACTANDVAFVLVGLGVEDDGCLNVNDTVSIFLRANMKTTAQTRYDVGMWVALDGGDAFNANPATTGLCGRQILRPYGTVTGDCDSNPYDGTGGQPICTVLDGDGPYWLKEGGGSNEPIDRCADIQQEAWSSNQDPQPIAVFDFVSPPPVDLLTTPAPKLAYKLPCKDGNPIDGFVELGTCATWDQQAKTRCDNFAQNTVDQSSKCNCEYINTDIPVPNLNVSCSLPGATINPGQSVSNTVTVTNQLLAGSTCTPSGSPERFQCGTAGFVRFVVEYDETRGEITSWNVGSGDIVVDDGSRLIWTMKNPIGIDLGVIGPFAGSRALTYTYMLTDTTSTNTLSFSTVTWWSDTLDTANLGILTGATPQSCTNCTCSTNVSTTPVTLAAFSAEPDLDQVRFQWSTATEVGTAGFYLLGRQGDTWVRLDDEPIASLGGDSIERRDYSATLRVPDGMTEFAIEEIDTRGRTTRKGPFQLGRPAGRRVTAETIPWETIRSGHRERVQQREHSRRASQRVAVEGATIASAATPNIPSIGSAAPRIELGVTRDGLYRVTYEDLTAAGFSLGKFKGDRIGLTAGGREVPIYVRLGADAKAGWFGPGSYLEFIGRAAHTLYTNRNVYRLSFDAKSPARVLSDANPPSPRQSPATYLATRSVERDRDYAVTSPIGDPWYDTRMVVYSSARQWRFPFEVDGYADGSGPARLAIRLYGDSNLPADPDHHLAVSLNQVSLGDVTFDGLTEKVVSIQLPEEVLRNGTNTLALTLPADLGVVFDVVVLEGFEVTYPRTFTAVGDALDFTAWGARFDVDGFTTPDLVAYREGRYGTARLDGLTVERDERGWRASMPGDLDAGSRYRVVSTANLLKPELSASRPWTEITSGTADYLAIVHPDFLEGIQPLLELRRSQGHTVRAVDVEDIYAQYGDGIFGAEAIRSYLAAVAPRMGVRQVLLVGGDTYDYLDHLGTGAISFIPSLYIPTGPVVRFAPTDPAYVDLDRDGTPDLAIGRLPVRTAKELELVVGKIRDYESKDYGGTAIFAADSSDPAANVPFAAASNAIAGRLPAGWQVGKAYLDSMAVANARTVLTSAIDRGVALTNFVGHSGTTSWTFQDLFDTQDAVALVNEERPTVVVQWGCWNTYYASPRVETLATTLMLSGDRGAAAVLGATTLTDDWSENLLGRELATRVAVPGVSLGDAVREAKQALAADHPELVDVLLGWTLLGDPAMPVER